MRGPTRPDILDQWSRLVLAHQADPNATEEAARQAFAASHLPPVEVAPIRPGGGLFARLQASTLASMAKANRDESVQWWLTLLEAMDFAAAVLTVQYGGQRVRVRKTDGTPAETAAALGELLREGVALAEAFRRLGISRATGYRLLKRSDRDK